MMKCKRKRGWTPISAVGGEWESDHFYLREHLIYCQHLDRYSPSAAERKPRLVALDEIPGEIKEMARKIDKKAKAAERKKCAGCGSMNPPNYFVCGEVCCRHEI